MDLVGNLVASILTVTQDGTSQIKIKIAKSSSKEGHFSEIELSKRCISRAVNGGKRMDLPFCAVGRDLFQRNGRDASK